MLHRIIFVFTIFFFPLYSIRSQQFNNDSFELHGSVIGKITTEYIYISYFNNKNIKTIDSTNIINSKFIFKGFISSPTPIFISNNIQFRLDGINSAIIYLEPKKMSIDVDVDDFKTLKLQGSKTQNEYIELEEIKRNISNKRDSISKFYRIYFNQIDATSDTIIKNNLQNKVSELDKFIIQITDKEIKLEFNFIKQNPSSFVCLDLLLPRLRKRQVTYDNINSLFYSLTKNVRSSEKGKQFLQILENFKNSEIGSLAPDFKVKDINNNYLYLDSFLNKKYVLLDFWASWCAPCREDLPILKSAYNKYSKLGFDIISISKDLNSELWKNAILKEEIQKWRHISIKENDNPIDETYVVTAIPVKILINKEGKIIGRWKGGGKENQEELKKMLAGIFEN